MEIERSLVDSVLANIISFGKYKNSMAIPSSYDGLIPAHRRSLMSMKDLSKGSKSVLKVPRVTGHIVGSYHPHAENEGLVIWLARHNYAKGIGQFGSKRGYEPAESAAGRYLAIETIPEVQEVLFGLQKYAPKFTNELDHEESDYLIVPLPLSLIHGFSLMGYSTSANVPSLDADSLIKAYEADDYSLIKSNHGLDIVQSRSQMKELWQTGRGRITLTGTVTKEDDYSVRLQMDGSIFKPRLKKLFQWEEQGYVLVHNDSLDTIDFTFEKVKSKRTVTMDMIEKEVRAAATYRDTYDLKVLHEGQIGRVGMKAWIDFTMSNFMKALEQRTNDEILAIDHKLKVAKLLPDVVDLLKKDMSDDDIVKNLTKKFDYATAEIISGILGKSLRSLRKTDQAKEMSKLTAKLDELNGIDAAELTMAKSKSFVGALKASN